MNTTLTPPPLYYLILITILLSIDTPTAVAKEKPVYYKWAYFVLAGAGMLLIASVQGWIHVDYTAPQDSSIVQNTIDKDLSVNKDGQLKLFDSASE